MDIEPIQSEWINIFLDSYSTRWKTGRVCILSNSIKKPPEPYSKYIFIEHLDFFNTIYINYFTFFIE
jgi:hypothetical protein